MFVAVSRFVVRNGLEDEVARAFADRPHLVDDVAGFVRLDVLRPHDDPRSFVLLTYWTDEESFRTWHAGHGRSGAHAGIPAGLRLVPGQTRLETYHHVTD